MANTRAAEVLRPDSDGYIRDWLMLAPIALPEGETGAEAIFKEQLKGEAALRPKAGDKVKIGGKELTWQNITASTNYFDFNAVLKSVNDHAVGYMVTYIECDTERPDVIMAVASNDEENWQAYQQWHDPQQMELVPFWKDIEPDREQGVE